MIRGLADSILSPETYSRAHKKVGRKVEPDSQIVDRTVLISSWQSADRPSIPRRTPRVSVVVVLAEGHSVSPDILLNRLRARGDQEVDVLVACAGQPANLSALQRCVGDAQFLLAPAGTSPEELRELAMSKASGDIVTLLSGALLHADMAELQHCKTS
jgi:hypothetical protein